VTGSGNSLYIMPALSTTGDKFAVEDKCEVMVQTEKNKEEGKPARVKEVIESGPVMEIKAELLSGEKTPQVYRHSEESPGVFSSSWKKYEGATILCCSFKPTGDFIAVGTCNLRTRKGDLFMHEVKKNLEGDIEIIDTRVFPQGSKVSCCSFSPFDPNDRLATWKKYVVFGTQDKVVVQDVCSGAQVFVWDWQTEAPTSCSFSSDGQTLAIGTEKGGLFLLDMWKGVEIHKFDKQKQEDNQEHRISRTSAAPKCRDNKEGANTCCFSKDGTYIAVGDGSGEVVVWNFKQREEKQRWKHDPFDSSPVLSCSFSESKDKLRTDLVASVSEQQLKILQVGEQDCVYEDGNFSTISLTTCSFSNCGSFVAVAGRNRRTGILQLFRLEVESGLGTRKLKQAQKVELSFPGTCVNTCAFSPDCNWLLYGGKGGLRSFTREQLRDGEGKNTVILLDMKTVNNDRKTLHPFDVTGNVSNCCWSQNNKFFAAVAVRNTRHTNVRPWYLIIRTTKITQTKNNTQKNIAYELQPTPASQLELYGQRQDRHI